MSQTPPPTIDPAPSVPIRGTSSFKTLVDAFLTWLALAVAQFQAVATNVYNNAVDTWNNAVIASAQATAAVTAVNALPWTAATYVFGDVRYSTVDGRTYRCWLGLVSAADPALDRPHWVCISAGPLPYMHVQDRKASGTQGDGATSSVWNTRVLNTIVGSNTIPGASLSSNQITLPAGTYEVEAYGSAYDVSGHRMSLYNVSDSVDIHLGSSERIATTAGMSTNSNVSGRFILSATKALSLRHYIGTGGGTDLGRAVNTGQSEIYASVQLWKVD